MTLRTLTLAVALLGSGAIYASFHHPKQAHAEDCCTPPYCEPGDPPPCPGNGTPLEKTSLRKN